MSAPRLKRSYVLLAVAASGCLWFAANTLSGDFGYLVWIAPAPILYAVLNVSWWRALLVAFAAACIGRLSWLTYLASLFTLVPALIYLGTAALFTAVIAALTRFVVVRGERWYAVFAFPAFFTAFEFALLKLTPDGSAGSIAYSQVNYLPVIQVASVTGLLGITFLLTLAPSALALAWHFRRSGRPIGRVLAAPGLILLAALAFGCARLISASKGDEMRAGVAVLDESFHHITDHPDTAREHSTATEYARVIALLAEKGARIVVLPERCVNLTRAGEGEILATLGGVARANQVTVVFGCTDFGTDTLRNSSMVIDDRGRVVLRYNKARLIKFLEDQFTPGRTAGLFSWDGRAAGTAVCKDLDFPDYMRGYGRAAVLAIPAWDFGVDGWLHSRMAVLRGVEDGFSEVRAARRGRLTISDAYGRVLAEADCADLKTTTLEGTVPLGKKNTLYARWGDWFGWLDLALAALLLATAIVRLPHRIADPGGHLLSSKI